MNSQNGLAKSLAWLVVLAAGALTLAGLFGYFRHRTRDNSAKLERKIDSALKKADKLLEEVRRNMQPEGAS